MVISKSICHLGHYKMDESQVKCWLKQMVEIREDQGAGGFQKRADNKETLLEIKSYTENTETKHQDRSHAIVFGPFYSSGDIIIRANCSLSLLDQSEEL